MTQMFLAADQLINDEEKKKIKPSSLPSVSKEPSKGSPTNSIVNVKSVAALSFIALSLVGLYYALIKRNQRSAYEPL